MFAGRGVDVAQAVGTGQSMNRKKLLKPALMGCLLAPLSVVHGQSASEPQSTSSPTDSAAATPIPVAANETEAVTPVPGKSAGNRMIEEVVVTAEKREERLQDVPIAISAFTADRLAASGVQSTKDLQLVTPGLTITNSAGYNLIYLRGLGSAAFLSSFDPSVATYVDGIYVPSQQGTLTDLGGVERVEVLKGPQGTLFGRNSTGGAISVITKSPGNAAEYSASVETGRFAEWKAKVYFSQPITDTLAASVAALFSTQHPYYSVVGTPGNASPPPDYKLANDRTLGARFKLRWRPTDDLDLILAGYKFNQRSGQAALAQTVYPSPLGAALGVAAPAGPYQTNENTVPLAVSTTSSLYGNAKWSLHWFDLKFLYAHENIHDKKFIYDFDGGQPDLVSFSSLDIPNKLDTAELQFVSNKDGWTPQWLTWIGGLYYLHQDSGYDPFILTVAGDGGQTANGALLGLVSQQTIDAISNGLPLPPGIPLLGGPGLKLYVHGILDTKSYSGFVQGTADFTDWVSLTLGGRLQRESRYLPTSNVGLPATGASGSLPLITYDEPKKTVSNISPKVSLNFKPWDDALLYLTWSLGFKSGSYNVLAIYEPPSYVIPETVSSYEIGAKTEFFDHSLRVNTALFDILIKNLQTLTASLLEGGVLATQNIPSAKSRGAEFDVVWVPLQEADPGFVITGGGSYLDAVYTRYPNAQGFDETTGIVFNNGDFSGNRIARTPRFSESTTLSQTIAMNGGSLELAGDLYYNSGFFFTAQNTAETRQKAYSLLNTRVSYLYDAWKVRLTAFGQNLGNTAYKASSLTVDFGTQELLAPPRTYGIRLEWNY